MYGCVYVKGARACHVETGCELSLWTVGVSKMESMHAACLNRLMCDVKNVVEMFLCADVLLPRQCRLMYCHHSAIFLVVIQKCLSLGFYNLYPN